MKYVLNLMQKGILQAHKKANHYLNKTFTTKN